MISRRGHCLYCVSPYKEESGSCACTSCILNKAHCYSGDGHRWSLGRTILRALRLVISRNAMVSLPCQDACKEETFYSLASWNGRRDCKGREGRVCSFQKLQKLGFGIWGKRCTVVPLGGEAGVVEARPEECDGVGQAEPWGRAAGCQLCAGSIVRRSLEIQKRRAHWRILIKVFFNSKYWDGGKWLVLREVASGSGKCCFSLSHRAYAKQ